MDCDIIVCGAGIVGVCTALHLQQRGMAVCLVDRAEPGSGASYGNAGLIERSSVVPYAFPRQIGQLLLYASNTRPDVVYQPSALPGLAGWLWRYWQQSAPGPLQRATEAMLPLIERSVQEHDHLVNMAGAHGLISSRGWIEVFRSLTTFQGAADQARALRRFDVHYRLLDSAALTAVQPGLTELAVGGIHWTDPKTVRDPQALVRAYLALFEQSGGRFHSGDAFSLAQRQDLWTLDTVDGPLSSRQAVITLGADAAGVYQKLGYKIPLAIKRGYHLHFHGEERTPLVHSLCDSAAGFVLAPMTGGIRLTTGIEFALDSAPQRDLQLRRTEQIARRLFALGERTAALPWMGRRPCLPDMRPVIGAAPRHEGLWFNFGHAHHGLTLGPVTGRLLAEMITGQTPFTDPGAFRVERF